jgi:tetratricopeptide (TPR) repeat protein
LKKFYPIIIFLLFPLLPFAQDALREFRRLDSVATVCRKSGRNDTAIILLKEALSLSRKNKLYPEEVMSLKGLCELYRMKGNYDEALALYDELEPKARKAGLMEIYAASFSERGFIYWRKNDRVKTLTYIQKAISVFDTLKPGKASTSALVGIAFVYEEMKQPEQAMEIFRKVIPQYLDLIRQQIELKDYYGAAGCYLSLAAVYRQRISNDSSIFYLNRSIDLSRKNNFRNLLALAYSNYGIVCSLKNGSDCEKYFLQSISMYDTLHNKAGKSFTLAELLDWYMKKGQYSKMEAYLDEAIAVSQQGGDSSHLKDFCLKASIVYEKKKDFEKAYAYRLRYEQINERLYNARNNALMNEMLVRYESDAKQKENLYLQKQNRMLQNEKDLSLKVLKSEKQKNALIITGSVLLLLLIFFILRGLKLQRDNYSLKVKEQQVELVKLNEMKTLADLKTLQARINPHFLYNALNSITSLIHERPAEAEEMTIKLSKLFRYSINTQEANWSTVNEELNIVETYLDIERVRFGDRITFTVSADESILSAQIPRFLLQPLVENALKHGLRNKESGGILSVSISDLGGSIEIGVHDNGIPFQAELNVGYGLQSINDKLSLLYGSGWKMEMINEADKKIRIELPKK